LGSSSAELVKMLGMRAGLKKLKMDTGSEIPAP
jgi:hypothetical protein